MNRALIIYSLFVALTFTGTRCSDCPDPTNIDCPDYNPCHPDPFPCEPISAGVLLEDEVYSPGLENNLLGDTPTRKVSIYLPPGYDENTQKNYPVLYLLHGFLVDHEIWFGGRYMFLDIYKGMDVQKFMDDLISDEIVSPMIVVSPNSQNSFEGSWYSNSTLSGNWEDFIVQDLVTYIDNHYRTLTVPESRGIAGHSMGGQGALKIAMKHPELFSTVYALSASDLVMDDYILKAKKEYVLQAAQSQEDQYMNVDSSQVRSIISRAFVYAPNPSLLPFYGELPLTETGDLIDTTWQKWLKHDLHLMLPQYIENLLQLKAIRFDCGTSDGGITQNYIFSEALTELDIEHVFEAYDGNHYDGVAERMNNFVLKYFSSNLVHE